MSLEQHALGCTGRRSRVEIQVDEKNGGLFAREREQPFPTLNDHAFRRSEIEGAVLSRPIADEQRESRVYRAAFPLAVRTV